MNDRVIKQQFPCPAALSCAGPVPLPSACGGDECESCGATCGPDDCGPDPYRSDVEGDYTPVLKCQACRQESADGI